jgi:phosphate-selective porin
MVAALLAPTAVWSQVSESPSGTTRGWLRLEASARVQIDGRDADAFANDESAPFEIAHKRIGIRGSAGSALAFEVEAEVAARNPWRDVYVAYRRSTALRAQAGQFKLPFSLDKSTSATKLDFVYRSRAAEVLAPRRDRGVMVRGRVWHRRVGYEVGVFGGGASIAEAERGVARHAGRTMAVRVSTTPFAKAKGTISGLLADLHGGFAVTSGPVRADAGALRGRMVFGEEFFPASFAVEGRRRRSAAEARWRVGPASVTAEYIRMAEERRGQSVTGGDLAPLVGAGWYVSGTWALTGEDKARGLERPRTPLFHGGVGAVELAARVERIGFGSRGTGLVSMSPRAERVAPASDTLVTCGVNWHLNRWIKIQGNVIREDVRSAGGTGPRRPVSWGRVFRLQFAL